MQCKILPGCNLSGSLTRFHATGGKLTQSKDLPNTAKPGWRGIHLAAVIIRRKGKPTFFGQGGIQGFSNRRRIRTGKRGT